MRSAADELELARTWRDGGDHAGAEATLLAVAGAARTRAAETLSTRELYTVIRASAGLCEVCVARDDWAAAEDAVKLALAASEVLAPEIANRELALVAKPLAVAAVGSGHTDAARLAWAEAPRGARAEGRKGGALATARWALDARAPPRPSRPTSAEPSVGAAVGAPRGVAARVRAAPRARALPGRAGDAARFSVVPRRRRPRWTWRRGATAATTARRRPCGGGAPRTTLPPVLTRLATRRRYYGAATAAHELLLPRGGGGAATRVRSRRQVARLPPTRSRGRRPTKAPAPSSGPCAASRRRASSVAPARDAGSAAFCARGIRRGPWTRLWTRWSSSGCPVCGRRRPAIRNE